MMRPEDAVAAADCGADAIGLVFYKAAKRCLSLEQAEKVLSALPGFVTPVGLFFDAPADEVRETASRLRLRHIQLHGNESPDVVANLREFNVLKAIRVERTSLANTLDVWREAIGSKRLTNLKGLVLETPGVAHGGSGVANDWTTVREFVQRKAFDGLPPIIAAGGLTPETVGDVVRTVRPWAVDVASGIEAEFGKKSREKMTRFASEVQAGDAHPV
jgi:phosphoribosylanthranilate isomerase